MPTATRTPQTRAQIEATRDRALADYQSLLREMDRMPGGQQKEDRWAECQRLGAVVAGCRARLAGA